jgi:hypothetical protein
MHIRDHVNMIEAPIIFLKEAAIPKHFYSYFYQRNTISSDFLTKLISILVKAEILVLCWGFVQQVLQVAA